MTRSPYDKAKAVFDPLAHIFFSFDVEGEENLPEGGAYSIASNHVRWYDPILIGVQMPVQVSFAAKIELFRIPGVRRLMIDTRHIPLDRKNAHKREVLMPLIEAARARMDEGIVFGLFPEGTRSKDGRLLPLMRGAAIIAEKTGYPIVPIGISYSWHKLRRRARIVIGEPITSSQRSSREVTRELERRIAELSGQQPPSSIGMR